MKLWFHKLTHWEYWSARIVYFPTLMLWCWYALKFGSFRFYKYSNPGMTNGGLHGDGKMEFYEKLPTHAYPKTILIKANHTSEIIPAMDAKNMAFPVIVKPDVGCRGVGVMKIHDAASLLAYAGEMTEDFLIQEVIHYPLEIGLFYYRYPNKLHGAISGITIKHFLTVEGNGQHTLEELLEADPRFAMQKKKLATQLDLSEVLQKGERRCLVPFGNHNRGTQFLNGEERITDKLTQQIDDLLRKVPGFYYGRLDIRFKSWEELEAGKNYSIIEVNGAKSEPTHIYDPKQSFWFGQKEIFRHQRIFAEIIAMNRR